MTGLCALLVNFKEKFKPVDFSIIVEISVENLFEAITIREHFKEVKKNTGVENLWFQCNRDLPKYFWKIRGLKGNILTSMPD